MANSLVNLLAISVDLRLCCNEVTYHLYRIKIADARVIRKEGSIYLCRLGIISFAHQTRKRHFFLWTPLFSNCHYTDQFDRWAFLCPTSSIVWFFPPECSKMSKCHSPQHHPTTPLYHRSPSCRLTSIPRRPQFTTGTDLSRNSFK